MSAKSAKTSTKHPYAAIEWRVIDSPAYADLSFSARALLLQIARQLTKTNNGHLQATYSYLSRYGFSENTIARGIKELIAHGMIYRTCGDRQELGTKDFKRIAAKYAVTWLSITDRKGLFLDGFVSCAWRGFVSEIKKNPPPKLDAHTPQIGGSAPPAPPKFAAEPPPKSEDIELITNIHREAVHQSSIRHPRQTAGIHHFPPIASGRLQPLRNYA